MKYFRLVLLAYSALALVLYLLFAPTSPTDNSFVLAQGKKCPDIVKSAINLTNLKCGATGRNKACYGNVAIQAEAQGGASNFTFAQPGDVVNLADIKTLKLSAFNQAANNWGVALLRLQGDLPDTAPGQNVTALVFGDVEMTESSKTVAQNINQSIDATNTAVAPTISAADTLVAPTRAMEETQVMGTYFIAPQTQVAGTKIALTQGADANNTQIAATIQTRVASRDLTAQAQANAANAAAQAQATRNAIAAAGRTATVEAQVTGFYATQNARGTQFYSTVAANNTAYAVAQQEYATQIFATVLAPPPPVVYKPMQAFYFRSGTGASDCTDLPHSGVILQTPGTRKVKLTVNGADLVIGSTAYLTAEPNGDMEIYALEGGVSVTAKGVTQPALAGLVVGVPMDGTLNPAGPPTAPQAYGVNDLLGLPIRILPRQILAAKPRTNAVTGRLESSSGGDVCAKGSVTVGANAPGGMEIVGLYVGGIWSADAGTTATFKASGDLRIQGPWRDYLILTTSGDPSATGDLADAEFDDAYASFAAAFAKSGGSDTLTYTFTKAREQFFVGVGSVAPGGVSVTVTCNNPATATPTPSLTPSKTNTPTK